jgi:PAS domain S-box-containing protein
MRQSRNPKAPQLPKIAEHRPRDKQKVRVRSQDLAALLRLAETATQSLDTNKIITDTLDESLAFLGFEVGFVRIIEPEKGGMVVRAARGLRSPEFLQGVTPLDDSRRNVSLIVYETKEPYICTDIRRDPIYKNRSMQREGVVSTAAAPILSKSRVLGIIVVGSRKSHKFAQREIHLLKAFGSQLGAALENAQLYEQVNRGRDYIENLLENAGDAIVSTDAQDTILSWNRAAEVIFGYSREEVIGKNLAMLAPQSHPTELVELRTKIELTGPMRNLEVRRKRKDGSIFNVALAVSPIRSNDERIVGFLYIAKDITETKRYEKRLLQLDHMKSDFVSNVSHELRTPLTAIKGSVDNMLDGITGELNEKQSRYLARIKSNADRLGRLINELLDLSRIESGKIDLIYVNLPVVSLAKEVAEILRPMAAEKLISLEVSDNGEEIHAWADRDKITQVLINIVGNAVKFTPSNGKITITVDKRKQGFVTLSVQDTGPGIPEGELDKVTDKFYQVARVNKEKTKGAGLGLAISKALVDMHGGQLWIASELGKGSVFSFSIPARKPISSEVPGAMGGDDGSSNPARR